MTRPLRATLSSEQTSHPEPRDSASAQTLSSPPPPSPVRETSPSHAHNKPHIHRIHRRRLTLMHPLQVRMLSMILSYTLIIFLLLAIPVFRPLMQALDDYSLSWQERAVVSNNLLDLHARYWPWTLGAGLVLMIHCIHSMWIVSQVAGSLYRLKSMFSQIGQGNLSIRTTLRKGDFVTSEAELVNQMTAQLDAKSARSRWRRQSSLLISTG